ncbi:hypothetical protein BDS110ZK25_41510 [Bradyrhizobium diazoefficiens]
MQNIEAFKANRPLFVQANEEAKNGITLDEPVGTRTCVPLDADEYLIRGRPPDVREDLWAFVAGEDRVQHLRLNFMLLTVGRARWRARQIEPSRKQRVSGGKSVQSGGLRRGRAGEYPTQQRREGLRSAIASQPDWQGQAALRDFPMPPVLAA